MLYYGLAKPLVSDSEYDDMCKVLSTNWKHLSPVHQFCLGSAKKIAATGMHVKITSAAEGGTIDWLRSNGIHKEVIATASAKWNEKLQVSWRNCSNYDWLEEKEYHETV
jgi:hypothetical protein